MFYVSYDSIITFVLLSKKAFSHKNLNYRYFELCSLIEVKERDFKNEVVTFTLVIIMLYEMVNLLTDNLKEFCFN
jgi:hypothetical protein